LNLEDLKATYITALTGNGFTAWGARRRFEQTLTASAMDAYQTRVQGVDLDTIREQLIGAVRASWGTDVLEPIQAASEDVSFFPYVGRDPQERFTLSASSILRSYFQDIIPDVLGNAVLRLLAPQKLLQYTQALDEQGRTGPTTDRPRGRGHGRPTLAAARPGGSRADPRLAGSDRSRSDPRRRPCGGRGTVRGSQRG